MSKQELRLRTNVLIRFCREMGKNLTDLNNLDSAIYIAFGDYPCVELLELIREELKIQNELDLRSDLFIAIGKIGQSSSNSKENKDSLLIVDL